MKASIHEETVEASTGSQEGLQLTVSNPSILLNHMAEAYPDLSRIAMEFVDNALDDAEALLVREEASSAPFPGSFSLGYARPVHVRIYVNRESRSLRVVDNCRGMDLETLKRVVLNVGESRKRGMAFLNGQFGFGMQSFRACAKRLRVRTRREGDPRAHEITVDRDSAGGFQVGVLEDWMLGEDAHTGAAWTGTEVTLEELDEHWTGDGSLGVEEIAGEIECHFERLLSRGNLAISVHDETADGEVRDTNAWIPDRVCAPYDYSSGEVVVDTTLSWPPPKPTSSSEVPSPSPKQTARVVLAVVPKEARERSPRFFVNGRRIANVGQVPAFCKKTKNRWSVWNHPQVIGYIDITNGDGCEDPPIAPTITRDDFKRTKAADACFQHLAGETEAQVLRELERINRSHADKSMNKLQAVVTDALGKVFREERREEKKREKRAVHEVGEVGGGHGSLATGVDTGFSVDLSSTPLRIHDTPPAGADDDGKQKKRPAALKPSTADFSVMLVRGLPAEHNADAAQGGRRKRSALVGNTIQVDVSHPDFVSRLQQSRAGKERVSERACGYISAVVSAHYRDRRYIEKGVTDGMLDREVIYEDLISTYVRLEEKLRANLPALLRALDLDDRNS